MWCVYVCCEWVWGVCVCAVSVWGVCVCVSVGYVCGVSVTVSE